MKQAPVTKSSGPQEQTSAWSKWDSGGLETGPEWCPKLRGAGLLSQMLLGADALLPGNLPAKNILHLLPGLGLSACPTLPSSAPGPGIGDGALSPAWPEAHPAHPAFRRVPPGTAFCLHSLQGCSCSPGAMAGLGTAVTQNHPVLSGWHREHPCPGKVVKYLPACKKGRSKALGAFWCGWRNCPHRGWKVLVMLRCCRHTHLLVLNPTPSSHAPVPKIITRFA